MPDGPVQLMFSVQDLTHHDSPDNIIACPAQGKTGRCFSRGKGFPSGLRTVPRLFFCFAIGLPHGKIKAILLGNEVFP